ncbi:MAG: hypothetical protein KKG59_00550 [Nanoarchaeota archaeon]|nr:hypothetical protein [Nanoarchaeota archaeon]
MRNEYPALFDDSGEKLADFDERVKAYFPFVEPHLKLHRNNPHVVYGRLDARMVFSEINVEGLEAILELKAAHERRGEKASMVHFPNHSSMWDFQIVQTRLAIAGIAAIIQAGYNLSTPMSDGMLRDCGALFVFRDDTTIYDENVWLNFAKDLAQKTLNLKDRQYEPGKGRMRVDLENLMIHTGQAMARPIRKIGGESTLFIDKHMSTAIYEAIVPEIFRQGLDFLPFAGETKIKPPEGGKPVRKVGRSYTGLFTNYSLIPFKLPMTLPNNNGSERYFTPVFISYERLVEDQLFGFLQEMARSDNPVVKAGANAIDYAHSRVHRLVQRGGRVHVAFGEPIAVKDLKEQGYTYRDAPKLIHQKAGELAVFYPTQMVALAVYLEKGGKIIPDKQAGKENPANDKKVSKRDLADRIDMLIETLPQESLKYLPRGTNEIIAQAQDQFWQTGLRSRHVADLSGKYVHINKPEILQQYANHNLHLVPEDMQRELITEANL